MAKRRRINRRKSRRSFSKGAARVHRKNAPRSTIMRGGYRL